jgi:hypothetical protein
LEVRRRKSERAAFLVTRGIDASALSSCERDRVAQAVADELGKVPARSANGLQGVLERIQCCPNGNRYAIIVGESEVAAVVSGKKLESLLGRDVKISFGVSEQGARRTLAVTPVQMPARAPRPEDQRDRR